MTPELFCERYPRLYHMASGDSLDSIRKYGLLSSKAITEMLQISHSHAEELLTKRRPESVVLQHAEFGAFTLRDQKPIDDAKLAACLTDVTLPEWYRLLNSRSFLWATKDRLETLANARAYRNLNRLILTVNSEAFMHKYGQSVEVSSINSGATFYVPVKRGTTTFVRLAEFPASGRNIAEITVPHGIPDLIDFVEEIELRTADEEA